MKPHVWTFRTRVMNGSGVFIQSINSLGNRLSRDVSLGDLDGDGDLDAFVANFNDTNRVWLNDDDTDMDNVADSIDNCPDDDNPGQENLDGDPLGNVCDDDVDGDGTLNDDDPDDDNDGVLDGSETGGPSDNPHAFDPDRDDDGIIDGLDPEPDTASNSPTCENEAGPLATVSFTQQIGNATDVTCAATEMITLEPSAEVQAGGILRLIAPETAFDPGTQTIHVDNGGTLVIISADPTAPIPNPTP